MKKDLYCNMMIECLDWCKLVKVQIEFQGIVETGLNIIYSRM